MTKKDRKKKKRNKIASNHTWSRGVKCVKQNFKTNYKPLTSKTSIKQGLFHEKSTEVQKCKKEFMTLSRDKRLHVPVLEKRLGSRVHKEGLSGLNIVIITSNNQRLQSAGNNDQTQNAFVPELCFV